MEERERRKGYEKEEKKGKRGLQTNKKGLQTKKERAAN